MKKDYGKQALQRHKKLHGKLEVTSKAKLKTRDDWSTYYTPGVAAVSLHVAKYPKHARDYTMVRNTVAVVSDGSAVLGLGNIGALGALPVMEGKAVIFKEVAGVDAFPIVLDTQDVDAVVETIKNIAPGFGGINLEDFSAPRCFEIEDRLKKELSIPVMHDDQHGTAIVVLAGIINAAKVVGKNIKKLKIVVIGAGAAGTAVSRLLVKFGIKNVSVVDSKGVIHKKRKSLSGYKKDLAKTTNPEGLQGSAGDVLVGADVVIGVSGPGSIKAGFIETMASKPIVFALANPTPEIMPEDALKAGAFVVATGRSDFPNQVNNALVFPGIFRGALDNGVKSITDEMKLKAAKKLAGLIKKPTAKNIIPSVRMKGVVKAIASVVK